MRLLHRHNNACTVSTLYSALHKYLAPSRRTTPHGLLVQAVQWQQRWGVGRAATAFGDTRSKATRTSSPVWCR